MGGGTSKAVLANADHDFTRLKRGKGGILITELYDSDVDDEFGYDTDHFEKNEAARDVPGFRQRTTKDGIAKVVATFNSLHPHTKTGKHLMADNGRQWGDDEAHIPDMALDFIYGFCSGESLRQTMAYTETGDICYVSGGTVVTYIHAGAVDEEEAGEPGLSADLPHRQCSYFEHPCNNDFTCIDMHKDGHIVAAGEYGPRAAVYVFNCYTMEVLAKLTKIPSEGVQCLSFSADGKTLACVGLDARATLSVFEWEHRDGPKLLCHDYCLKTRRDGLPQKVYAMHFVTAVQHSDLAPMVYANKVWTCGTQDTRVWSVDTEDDEILGAAVQYGVEDIIQTSLCLAFDPHGDAITGTKSGDIYFFRKNKLFKVERGRHRGPVNCVRCEQRPQDVGGPVLFTAGKDGVIQEWAMKKDTLQYLNEVEWKIGRRFQPTSRDGKPWVIRSLALHCTNGILGFGSRDGAMHEFRFGDTNGQGENSKKEEESAEDVLEESFVTLLEPLYDKRPDKGKFHMASKAEGGICIALHPTQYTLATADWSTVRLWDMVQRELKSTVPITGGGTIVSMEYSPNGELFAVGLDNGMVILYDAKTDDKWKPGAVRKDRNGRITRVKFSPEGDLLAAGSDEGLVDVYDVKHSLRLINTCQPSKTMGAGRASQGHGSPIVHIDWGKDGTRLKTTCESMEMLFWEVGLFRGGSGQAVLAPGVADIDWATWTCPMGWHTTGMVGQVEAVSNVIGSARAHTEQRHWMAVGSYGGAVTIFPFPCREGQEYEVAELEHATARLTDVQITVDDQFMVTAGVDGIFQWRVVHEDEEDEEDSEEQRQLASEASAKRLLEVNSTWDSMDGDDRDTAASLGIDSRLLGADPMGDSARLQNSATSLGIAAGLPGLGDSSIGGMSKRREPAGFGAQVSTAGTTFLGDSVVEEGDEGEEDD
jgi:WD40 repeat protein